MNIVFLMGYLLERIQSFIEMTTVNQLLAITHDIYKYLDSGKDVCALFLDVSKAFEKGMARGIDI